MSGKNSHPVPQAEPGAVLRDGQQSRRREITSAELFAGGREIHIHHAEEIYTLRQTSKGKLILTK